MIESPPTRASLLIRLRDTQDQEAWRQFIEIYSSLIYGFARRRGLQDADAADLMQEVLRSVSTAMGHLNYDPARGSFRGWLHTITRNKLITFLDRQKRLIRGTGESGTHERLAEEPWPDEDHLWDEEYERRLFAWAAERVRTGAGESVWQAFWQTAVDGKAPKDVAKSLGISVGAVYVAKSRILAQVKAQIQQLQEA